MIKLISRKVSHLQLTNTLHCLTLDDKHAFITKKEMLCMCQNIEHTHTHTVEPQLYQVQTRNYQHLHYCQVFVVLGPDRRGIFFFPIACNNKR